MTCQPRSRPGVGGMKRGRELADGRQTQLSSGEVEQVLFRSEEEGRCQVRPGGRESKPGSYGNTWRVVVENMRELKGLWGTGGRRDDSSTPLFDWRSVCDSHSRCGDRPIGT